MKTRVDLGRVRRLVGPVGADWNEADGVETAVSFLLHESLPGARAIARQFRRSIASTRREWELIGRESTSATLARLDAIDTPDIEAFSNFMAHEKRGVVLLTPHFGCYLPGFIRLLLEMKERRAFIVRRRHTDTSGFEAGIFDKLGALGIDFDVIRIGGRGVWKLARGMQEGGVALMPYDLPRRWGPTATVDVLNVQMEWVRGPYEIAARSNALLAPFLCMKRGATSTLLLGRVVALERGGHRDPRYVQAIAQRFADAASVAIRNFPGQWHHWTLLGEMTPRTAAVEP